MRPKRVQSKKCKLPEELEISGVQVAIGLRTSLKVIQHSRGGTVLHFVIGQENSRNFLKQSEPKLKLITTWSPAYSRALASLLF